MTLRISVFSRCLVFAYTVSFVSLIPLNLANVRQLSSVLWTTGAQDNYYSMYAYSCTADPDRVHPPACIMQQHTGGGLLVA